MKNKVQIKIITSISVDLIEENTNKWLSENDNILITDINLSFENGMYILFLTYEIEK